MSSISEKLSAINSIKHDIRSAINQKGVPFDTSTPFSEYPEKILMIPQEISGGDVDPVSIEIVSPPKRLVYAIGDVFDPTGITVRVHFSNGFSPYIGNEYLLFFPVGGLTENDLFVTVGLQWGELILTASQEIDIGPGAVWGVAWNYSNSDPALSRLTPDNDPNHLVTRIVDEEPVAQMGDSGGSSIFDDYMPWSGMYECNIVASGVIMKEDPGFSRSENDTMIYIPEFYYQCIDDNTNSIRYWYVADRKIPGMKLHPGSGKYISRYETGSESRSMSGLSVTRSLYFDTFRERAVAKGSGWGICDYKTYCAVALLALVEYATWDLAHAIGPGVTSGGFRNTGGTDMMTYHTGSTGAGETYPMQYRGVEHLYGNMWKAVDGLICIGTKVCVADNPENYGDYDSYTRLFTIISGSYVSQILYSEEYSWAFFAEAANGSLTTYTTDRYYSGKNPYGVYAVGDDYHGYGSGIAAALVNWASMSDSQVGTRLMFDPQRK